MGQVRRRSIPAYLCAGRGAPGFSGRCAYGTLRPFLFAGACIIILLYLLTAAALHIAERHGRRTGSFTLF